MAEAAEGRTMATRLRVALVGQAAEHRLVKLELVGTRDAL